MLRYGIIAAVLLTAAVAVLVSREPKTAAPKAFRRAEQNGWIYVHLEGSPAQIGFQHGSLLASEIREAQRIMALEMERDTKKDWMFFRDAALSVIWRNVDPEYRQEIQGIAAGLNAHGVPFDYVDITVMNAWQELSPYWFNWHQKQQTGKETARAAVPERCSAFVATGSYTKSGKPVIGHNAWTGYLEGERWNIIFDIVPQRGYHILMDGFPGLIHSADDFGINSAGIMITETTITQFSGFDPDGIPEFSRARRAMQYSTSIDDFARIMKEGNNGGYANNWLVADRKTNEVADLELGLRNVNLWRTKDGYFSGANFPVDPKLAREETEFATGDPSKSPNARRVRWDQLMAEYKGKIDVAAGQKFLSDHFDTFEKKEAPSERTLCGHIDLSPRGMKPWQQEFAAAGAVQAKVTDAEMASRMAIMAAMGHSCGIHFKAAPYLKEHPEAAWMQPLLRDMNSHPWTEFRAAK